MSILISLKIPDGGREVRRWLAGIKGREVPESRLRLVRRVSRKVLEQTIEHNPVDTARSRAAWVESLEQLGGQPPPNWQGAQAQSDAIGEGRSLGGLSEADESERSEIQVTNRVDYINYLEFGTRKMSAFQMVERSLRTVRPTIPRQPFFVAPADEMGILG